MTLVSYRIDFVYNVRQILWNPWRAWPMGLSAVVSDKETLIHNLESCKIKVVYHSTCGQEVVDNLTVIYQTYFQESRSPLSIPMVEVDGKINILRYKDDRDSHFTGRRLVGNVLPLTTGVYLATDFRKGEVTKFIAPCFNCDRYPVTKSRRGRTVSLSNGGRIGGITRDDKYLIARFGRGPEIYFYRLDDIVISNELAAEKPIKVQRIVRPKCLDKSGQYQDIILNEIEYEPESNKLWGIQAKSAHMIEFDIESGKCVGELNLFDALKTFALEMIQLAQDRTEWEFQPDVDQISKLELPSTVVNGIAFIAKNWLMISVANITTRFIVQINGKS